MPVRSERRYNPEDIVVSALIFSDVKPLCRVNVMRMDYTGRAEPGSTEMPVGNSGALVRSGGVTRARGVGGP